MDKKEVIDFFDARAVGWDAVQVRNEEVIGFILDKAEVTKGKHILDIACGTGVLFPDYLLRGVKVTGVDISPEMVRIAKEKFPQVQVLCADAEIYSFEQEYDIAIIYNAFPHFVEAEKLFANLSRALKHGGRLAVAHGISEKELELCHKGPAENVSVPLVKKEILSEMMSSWFDVDVLISDERMYMVSGVKK
jgi:demethylmenaquinone methyltransferase/2-methoxy-6-polyprenyl-1,4-benzoquinol methylase